MLPTISVLLLLTTAKCPLSNRKISLSSKRPFGAFLFGLNIFMIVETEKDFPEVRKKVDEWKKRFPMFRHDVKQIENIIESHIQNYSIALVHYRQTHKKNYLENAEKEIQAINNVVAIAEKMELMAILSQ